MFESRKGIFSQIGKNLSKSGFHPVKDQKRYIEFQDDGKETTSPGDNRTVSRDNQGDQRRFSPTISNTSRGRTTPTRKNATRKSPNSNNHSTNGIRSPNNTRSPVLVGRAIRTKSPTIAIQRNPTMVVQSPVVSRTVKNDDILTEDEYNKQKLRKAILFAFCFMLAELFGGLIANSVAIMTDAAHMLSDIGGLFVSLLAVSLTSKAATWQYTFGFLQAEIVGAFLSISIVWVLTAGLMIEAAHRMTALEEVDGRLMFFLALLGLVVNIVLLETLGHSHGHGPDGGACCGGKAGDRTTRATALNFLKDSSISSIISDQVSDRVWSRKMPKELFAGSDPLLQGLHGKDPTQQDQCCIDGSCLPTFSLFGIGQNPKPLGPPVKNVKTLLDSSEKTISNVTDATASPHDTNASSGSINLETVNLEDEDDYCVGVEDEEEDYCVGIDSDEDAVIAPRMLMSFSPISMTGINKMLAPPIQLSPPTTAKMLLPDLLTDDLESSQARLSQAKPQHRLERKIKLDWSGSSSSSHHSLHPVGSSTGATKHSKGSTGSRNNVVLDIDGVNDGNSRGGGSPSSVGNSGPLNGRGSKSGPVKVDVNHDKTNPKSNSNRLGNSSSSASIGSNDDGDMHKTLMKKPNNVLEHRNLAMRAAVIHIIGDIIQSFGVLLAALCIWIEPFDVGYTEMLHYDDSTDGDTLDHPHLKRISNWHYVDPLCTFIFAVLVLLTTRNTTYSVLGKLMMKVPDEIDLEEMKADLQSIQVTTNSCIHGGSSASSETYAGNTAIEARGNSLTGRDQRPLVFTTTSVKCIHDLHIWNVGNFPVLTCHVVVTIEEQGRNENTTLEQQERDRPEIKASMVGDDGQPNHFEDALSSSAGDSGVPTGSKNSSVTGNGIIGSATGVAGVDNPVVLGNSNAGRRGSGDPSENGIIRKNGNNGPLNGQPFNGRRPLNPLTPILAEITNLIRLKYNIEHTTIQIEIDSEYDHSIETYGGIHEKEDEILWMGCCRGRE